VTFESVGLGLICFPFFGLVLGAQSTSFLHGRPRRDGARDQIDEIDLTPRPIVRIGDGSIY
jgi:hypothetical protein